MKKYKYRPKVFAVSLLGLGINALLILLIDVSLLRVVLSIGVGLALFNIMNLSFSYYELTISHLVLTSMFRKIELELSAIKHIGRQPAGKFVGESIRISSINNKLSITALTNDYWELISNLIDLLPLKDSVEIDRYILDKIK